MPSFPPSKADSALFCNYCQSNLHSGDGCVVKLLSTCKEIREKLENRCNLTPHWWTSLCKRMLTEGHKLVQHWHNVNRCLSVVRECLALCDSVSRRNVWVLSTWLYSEQHCNFSILNLTNQPANISTVVHRSSKLVEPRSNTIPGGKWRYKTGLQGLVKGFYWQCDSDGSQLVNSPGILRIACATRHGYYKAIEIDEEFFDIHTREYQETQRNSSPIDNWLRRDTEFVRDNLLLWSQYLEKHDNSAESIVSRPDQLPSSEAYKRCTRQRLARLPWGTKLLICDLETFISPWALFYRVMYSSTLCSFWSLLWC